MAEYKHIALHVENRVGWVDFDRPPINAMHPDMVREIHQGVRQYHDDEQVRVIVLGSAMARFFSTGADIAVFKTMSRDELVDWADMAHDLVRTLRQSDKPLLAAIGGTAVGSGLEMTLHCDLRFAATDARFGQPEININYIPPVGATQALARLIGRPRAIRLLYDGEMFSAQEAHDMGLVDTLLAPDELRREVQAYGESLAAKPPEALAAIRQTVTLGGSMSFDEGLALEREHIVRLAESENLREGLAAFLEKRPPQWQG
ncbi:MAG: enoyl-CoA hydratase/isomerase family protein [Rhodospirillaceae bacterium]|jgi:enoyl-CoA hydratase/carnithine racemase|nr:enoyl-CoA hydratase/isomerase family protein [Rhodospirillaceae bacterium]MBT4491509.1 enoyl-CoA hydratase/isomerase family protein [Rhodospirillaceae bacterium]MBT5191212.1 enoyl-CoA hydratase/isomerase family protein [Rhodospirillaceae bacterium]MBT5897415.1 enoyl-CoA hydratase/isomerase family protein [Rhodospirillaceae bacterium]MBT6428383.1 enoyl-CoA hydratase/isomerase family protein [Rhodospirillaceae bacterium]